MYSYRKILIPNQVWDSKNKDEFKQKLSNYLGKSYPDVAQVTKVDKPFVIVEG